MKNANMIRSPFSPHRGWLLLFLCVALVACSRGKPFQPEAWKATPEIARDVFVADLRDRQLLMGKTKDEVKAILGKPSSELPDRMSYVIGSGSVFTFNRIIVLEAVLGPHGKVEDVLVRGD